MIMVANVIILCFVVSSKRSFQTSTISNLNYTYTYVCTCTRILWNVKLKFASNCCLDFGTRRGDANSNDRLFTLAEVLNCIPLYPIILYVSVRYERFVQSTGRIHYL